MKTKSGQSKSANSNSRNQIQFSPITKGLLKNSSHLLGGNAGAGLCGIAASFLTVNALGLEAFGWLIVIQSVHFTVRRLFDFQVARICIHFGVRYENDSDHKGLAELLKLCALSEAAMLLISALVSALLFLAWPTLFNTPIEMRWLAASYALANLTAWTGLPIAVFRLTGNFGLNGQLDLFCGLVQLALVTTVFLFFPIFSAFLLAMLASAIIKNTAYIGGGLVVCARKYSLARLLSAPVSLRPTRVHGFWPYVFYNHWNGTIRLFSTDLDVLVLNFLGGAPFAGALKLFKRISQVVMFAANPVSRVIYPDLARFLGSGNHVKAQTILVASTRLLAILTFSFWVLVLAGGAFFFPYLLGEPGLGFYVAACVYIAGTVLIASSVPLQQAIFAAGRADIAFWFLSVASLAYIVLLFTLVPSLGLTGVGLSYFLFGVLWSLLRLVFWRNSVVRKETKYLAGIR